MTDELLVLDFTLNELGLVDAPPEDSFDNLTKLTTQLLGVPVSLVSVVDSAGDRQFFKSQVGLTGHWASERQTPLSHSFCQHVVARNCPLVINDAREQDLVRDNLAIRDLGVIAYLGMPIYGPAGNPIGAMCAICDEPRSWSNDDQDKLAMIANCVTDQIRLRASLKTSELLRQEQREFTSVLSHDMKSPTNTLTLLHREIAISLNLGRKEDIEDLLRLCSGTTDRMTALVDEVLSYTHVTACSVETERVDMNDEVKSVIADLHGLIQETAAVVEVGGLPVVHGNPVQLRMLMQNLITNAIKFVKPGVVARVILSTATMSEYETHMVGISVQDNGIGIAPENREKIFKIFQRLHLREEYSGSGIGLAMCQRIAKNHFGKIEVNSSPEEGTEFLVKLPVRNYD